jgi:hypothetical protein
MIGEMKIDQQSGYKHVRQLLTKTATTGTHTAGLRQIPNETVSAKFPTKPYPFASSIRPMLALPHWRHEYVGPIGYDYRGIEPDQFGRERRYDQDFPRHSGSQGRCFAHQHS